MIVVGVTSVHSEACKRGLAANLAAAIARDAPTLGVVVVDGDPLSCDIGPRLGVVGPTVTRLAQLSAGVSRGALASLLGRTAWPVMRVVTSEASATLDPHHDRRVAALLDRLTGIGGLVVVDLPPGTCRAGYRGSALARRLDQLVVAVTASSDAVAAGRRLLDQLGPEAPPVSVAVTGDEATATLDPAACLRHFGTAGAAWIPQLWGRRAPNFGFGVTFGIAELDAGLCRLAEHRRPFVVPAASA